MAKLIQKSGFLSKKRAGRYMKYIATRDGVEILNEDAEGIYLRYIATRPRTEKHEGHGLFGAEPHVDLEKTMQELKTHEGNVWTIIYSLRREDAARLGYDNAESWRLALLAHQNDFAEAMQIPPEHLHWYAAFHDEGEHPHIHMMLWSDDSKYGFLRKDRLLHMQSVLTNTIYADELKEIYIQKDVAYKEVTEAARAVMRELVDRMESVSEPPVSIQQKLLELALELRTTSGKKQYAYLKKPLKDMVDSIVDELEKLPEVAAYYSVWNGLRDTLEGYYKNRPRQHNPLSQQKEFRAIKNAIIQEAERLRQQMEQAQATSEQETSQEEEPSSEETSTGASANPTLADENTSSATSYFVRLPSEYLLNSTIRLFHQMGQIFRDNAAPPSNPMGIRIDSKRRKKLMQKRLAMGHKQDDHEQNYGQTLQ
ncbi:MAG: MobP3 family relaxase [Oscillospiraceae bacterium]